MDNSIVPPHLAVKAMRDNGYKNAAYAIAELMDNSIQHGASIVELLCAEKDVLMTMRTVSRINQIAILDNGTGMTKKVLQMALQFGNGTHLEADNQKGIGKFGMGLPSSSISQAKKVEVWTWQEGINSAIYTYLDIDEIISQVMTVVPEPVKKEIPNVWINASDSYSETGTLVVWSNIDRCVWKTAKAIIDNSEFLIGRMYRKFIASNRVVIKMVSFNEGNPTNIETRLAKPNDPIYLMENTSCPNPYDNKAMFDKWGGDDGFEVKFKIPLDSEEHEVQLRFTIAKNEARLGSNAGARPHGQHAKKNLGVSIVRAERELDLDISWTNQYDPRERWWGVEIEFPPAIDEIFGVTNNKQFANNFSELGKIDLKELLSDGKTFSQLKDELKEEGDPKVYLIDIVQRIESQLTIIRAVINTQNKNEEMSERTRHANPQETAEKHATEVTEQRRMKDGDKGTSDKQEAKPIEERKAEIEKSLIEEGISNTDEVVDRLFGGPNLKYSFVVSEFQSFAFFNVRSMGGKIIISLNSKHPAYHKLVEVLQESTSETNEIELKQRLNNASDGLKLLLMAWARYEDEQPDGELKEYAQDARQDWGRIAKQFLKEE